MKDCKYEYLPKTTVSEAIEEGKIIEDNSFEKEEEVYEVVGDSPCPCCLNLTIPNKGDALAFICPVCMWEIDLFINSDNEISDLNHGLTLNEARENYKRFGAR